MMLHVEERERRSAFRYDSMEIFVLHSLLCVLCG